MKSIFVGTIALGVLAFGCSGNDSSPKPEGSGGANGAGGAQSTGGAAVAGIGGANTTGGTVSTGGAAETGGSNVGVGGTTIATGGRSAGGASAATGGRATGGANATGGRATGGNAAGGTAVGVGGSGTGGATAWGQATGGRPTTGGANTGGKSATGGANTGGKSATGGASSAGGSATKSTGCGKTTTLTGESTKTISVGGTSRTYIIRLPTNYNANTPYNLMTSIHCLNGTAAGVASGSAGTNYQYYGLLKLANNGTIFVAPQGINNSWPNSGGSDVAFIKALITELENTLCIDTTRVFAEGFSMGGSMSYALACAMPGTFRAIAVHSGGPMSGCDKTARKPVAYFMTHGINDSVCTYPGYGVPQINDFAQLNGCQAMDIPNTLKPTDTSGRTPVCGDFQGCSAGHPARACIFVGDHTPSPGGEATTWVPGETWKFLSQF